MGKNCNKTTNLLETFCVLSVISLLPFPLIAPVPSCLRSHFLSAGAQGGCWNAPRHRSPERFGTPLLCFGLNRSLYAGGSKRASSRAPEMRDDEPSPW
ncbi:hypothetical protein CDAR_60941 [Caerostris darwini]|uniref:Secreted protein n=1 Tax=Caerostris darwini TaxID=1538125 RepID=A0AAV4RWV6_9ARAC|nr:hypothetical protein CDAR_60941 [Caerostris darwini]